jgi:hypothetical protein
VPSHFTLSIQFVLLQLPFGCGSDPNSLTYVVKMGPKMEPYWRNIMLDAFPRSAGDHLAQSFSRKIKLISLTILH